jgi:PKD repeat protein
MDDPGNNPENSRKFFLPLCLLSLVFFILYFIIIVWIFSGTIRSSLEFILPSTTASILAGFSLFFMGTLIFLLSLAGAIWIVHEMRGRSLAWKAGLPLCIDLGALVFSTSFISLIPLSSTQQIFGYIVAGGFIFLPLCVAYLFSNLKRPEEDPAESDSIKILSLGAGVFGIVIILLLAISALTYVPPAPEPHSDHMFDFGPPLVLISLLLFLVYIAVILPLIGGKILGLGLKYRKIPREIIGDKSTKKNDAVHRPAKDSENLLRDLRVWLTPGRKRVILIVSVGLLLIGGSLAIWNATDTTPGRTWSQVTTTSPFGSKGAFASVEHKGTLWLFGGTGNQGSYGEAWHTPDGVVWTRESSSEMVPSRMGASAVVFRDGLWFIGGITERSFTPHNDVWYSGNGLQWTEMTPEAGFSPRAGHTSVVFNNRIWVIGGHTGGNPDSFSSDIWSSFDGITWKQETPSVGFSPRAGHSSFVFNDRIWVIGGWNSTATFNDVWSSVDGTHWTLVTASTAFGLGYYNAVIFDNRMWVIKQGQGIWYSDDGATWSKLVSSPPFFQEEFSGGPPLAIVFDNRLWVFQWHNSDTGIWFTMPGGQTSCRPSVNFNADKITGPAPITVAFTDESLCRPNQWQWDFGDGAQSTEQNPEHTFSMAGNYSIRLTAKNGAGESSQSLNITVFKSVSLPNADAGKHWNRATDKVPFGNREGYSVITWRDAMWVIAGAKIGGIPVYNDTWYSRDGNNWIQAVQNAGFEARSEHGTVVFNDKLWVIGGLTDYVNETGWHFPTIKNDTWYSTDGMTWTEATSSAGFPPLRYTKSILFNDRILLFGQGVSSPGDLKSDLILWSSGDGVHWNQSFLPSINYYNRLTPSVKDNRIWVLQYAADGGFWNSLDGNNRTVATMPPISETDYAIYTDSLTVADNKFWLFRAPMPRVDGTVVYEKVHGEIWYSDDGYHWVLVTDDVPFANGVRGLNDFHLIAFDNKLWAYMDRLVSKPFSNEWDNKMEIWYSDL